jgi:hypothetical protein
MSVDILFINQSHPHSHPTIHSYTHTLIPTHPLGRSKGIRNFYQFNPRNGGSIILCRRTSNSVEHGIFSLRYDDKENDHEPESSLRPVKQGRTRSWLLVKKIFFFFFFTFILLLALSLFTSRIRITVARAIH